MSSIHSVIVRGRLEEICPIKNTEDMSVNELIHDCRIAFKIIGYNPKNLERVVKDVYLNNDILNLYEFVFEVWRNDA